MKDIFIFIVIMMVGLQVNGEEITPLTAEEIDHRVLYVSLYKDIAIEEMKRTGIPASIKLAQGILESNSGRSELASKANNHFGIKCGGDWTGPTYYRKDDDFNKRGKLIESCFRAYKNPTSSFLAHSEFLTDPKKVSRYGFLFNLKNTDYKGWAHGLRKSGYATNPQYAAILIRIIEEMNLDEFDKSHVAKKNSRPALVKNMERSERSSSSNYMFEEINNIRMVYAKENSTPQAIAAVTGTDVRQIMKYNEELKSANETLPENYPVFLQPKRTGYAGKEKYHTTRKDETLFDISQRYGIKVSSLSKRNNIPSNVTLKAGQKIKLKGLFKNKNTPVTVSPDRSTPFKQEVPITHKVREVNAEHQTFHVVETGDTLFSLSRKYNVDVAMIKQLNNLEENTIKLGQKLRVK